ncbi:hypothetical protein JKP88DRAFT_264509 [Tribonema minus]|uniref:Uncharacterized protein n=1 Tax=Tribonema minus TaxID=303371 RepID=A0A836CCB9_9STRA|nr:hypothetical protein JKP88DRAFT_264509 [Tribonema minus]
MRSRIVRIRASMRSRWIFAHKARPWSAGTTRIFSRGAATTAAATQRACRAWPTAGLMRAAFAHVLKWGGERPGGQLLRWAAALAVPLRVAAGAARQLAATLLAAARLGNTTVQRYLVPLHTVFVYLRRELEPSRLLAQSLAAGVSTSTSSSTCDDTRSYATQLLQQRSKRSGRVARPLCLRDAQQASVIVDVRVRDRFATTSFVPICHLARLVSTAATPFLHWRRSADAAVAALHTPAEQCCRAAVRELCRLALRGRQRTHSDDVILALATLLKHPPRQLQVQTRLQVCCHAGFYACYLCCCAGAVMGKAECPMMAFVFHATIAKKLPQAQLGLQALAARRSACCPNHFHIITVCLIVSH